MPHGNNAKGLHGAISQIQGLLDYGNKDSVAGIVCLTYSGSDTDSIPTFSTFQAQPECIGRMLYHLLHYTIGVDEKLAEDISSLAASTVARNATDMSSLERDLSAHIAASEISRISKDPSSVSGPTRDSGNIDFDGPEDEEDA